MEYNRFALSTSQAKQGFEIYKLFLQNIYCLDKEHEILENAYIQTY